MTCKIIHQMWKDYDVPSECVSYIATWKHHHPDWEYRFWTDDDILKLITDEYSWFLDTYNNYEYNICRSDAARHIILHKHGGLYCDIDIECFRSVNDMFLDRCVVFDENPDDFGNILTNSIYYAPAGDPFMHRCIEYMNTRRLKRGNNEQLGYYVLRATGCIFLTGLYHKWKHVMPIDHLTHIHFERQSKHHRERLDKTYIPYDDEYGIHHMMNSWL